MSKNIASLLIVLLLGACASGGGSAGLVPQPEARAVSTAPSDPRPIYAGYPHLLPQLNRA